MKRFFYWFAWLQVGMPLFLVATTWAAAVDWKHSLLMGIQCIIFLAPFLLINSLPIAAILSRVKSRKVKVVVLTVDSVLAFIPVNQGPANDRMLLAAVAWASASALVIILALRWDPARHDLPGLRRL